MAVVAETCFLLSSSSFDPALALQFVERGVVQLLFVLQDQIQISAARIPTRCCAGNPIPTRNYRATGLTTAMSWSSFVSLR
jgi:hypothetical protein